MQFCSACGRPIELGWTFCGSCGLPIGQTQSGVDTEPVGPSVEAPADPSLASTAPGAFSDASASAISKKGRRTPRLRTVLLSLAALALVSGTALAGYRLNETIDRTEADLASTTDELSATSEQLSQTEGTLRATETKLGTTERERDELNAENQDLRLDLRGVRGTLRTAETRVELQSGQIQTLKTCLNGVALALDAVLYLDYRGAAKALQAVETECNEAFALV